jgi:hypothetical protein
MSVWEVAMDEMKIQGASQDRYFEPECSKE